MRLLSVKEAQFIDKQVEPIFHMPLLLLMENAGRGVAETITSTYDGSGIVLFCLGVGNNGADGLVAARHLQEMGYQVAAYIVGHKEKASALWTQQFDLAQQMDIPIMFHPDGEDVNDTLFAGIGYVVEGLVGTGCNGDLRTDVQDVLAAIDEYRLFMDELHGLTIPVLAIDVPAGVNSNTGQIGAGTIAVDYTVTLGAVKQGLVLYPGRDYSGDILVKPLGLPWDRLLDNEDMEKTIWVTSDVVSNMLPLRGMTAHKGSHGHALLIGGSQGMYGAPVMSAAACVQAGAGKTTLATENEALSTIQALVMPEIMTKGYMLSNSNTTVSNSNDSLSDLNKIESTSLDDCVDICYLLKEKDVVAVGPGLGRREVTERVVQCILEQASGPVILDADALYTEALLSYLARDREGRNNSLKIILTPHVGEFKKLTGLTVEEIEENRIEVARNYAEEKGVILVLKGVPTVVATPKGSVYVNSTGNPGMGTGGMGDVLTGIIAALVAQGMSPEEAAIAGVYVHGASADLLQEERPWGYTPSEVGLMIGFVLQELLTDGTTYNEV